MFAGFNRRNRQRVCKSSRHPSHVRIKEFPEKLNRIKL